MRIEELKNQFVKISNRSITCKNENGKTKGIVTNATSFLKIIVVILAKNRRRIFYKVNNSR